MPGIQHIIRDCGLPIRHYEQVYGGDINLAYCLYGPDTKYFLKVNDALQYPGMFEKERNGLLALQSKTSLTIPHAIKCGNINQQQYLLLEWMERGIPEVDFWQNFGTGLAILHQNRASFFGWEEDNFIGSLVQQNKQYQDWHLFFAECRVMPMVKTLFNAGIFSTQDLASAEFFCKRIEQLFPVEPPSLLHGDLWSGNYMISGTGYSSIFDPAVYCGHREMDIGMTMLFGGFDRQFYDAYNNTCPLEKGWQQRLHLTQLYPLLVHAVLFGGHYVGRAREIINLKADA